MRRALPPPSLDSLGALPAQARPLIRVWDQGLGRVSPGGLVLLLLAGSLPQSGLALGRAQPTETPLCTPHRSTWKASGSGVLRGPTSGRHRVGGEGSEPGPGVERPRSRLTVRCEAVVATLGRALAPSTSGACAFRSRPTVPGGPGISVSMGGRAVLAEGEATFFLEGAGVQASGALPTWV